MCVCVSKETTSLLSPLVCIDRFHCTTTYSLYMVIRITGQDIDTCMCVHVCMWMVNVVSSL